MILPLEQTLALVRPYVPDVLVGADACRSLLQTTRLPPAISCTYLECRLALEAGEVDFGASITATEGRQVIQALESLIQEPRDRQERAAWQCIQDLVRAWAVPESPMCSRVPVMWLEFDSAALNAGRLLPSVLLCIDPTLSRRSSLQSGSVGHGADDCLPALDAAIALLLRAPLEPETRANLRRCFDQLPAGGRIAHVGFMVARSPCFLKLFVSLRKEQVLSYLDGIGWPGSTSDMATLLATFGSVPDTFRLDLTIGSEILPRIGLEFASRGGVDPNRRALIELCVEQGLCTREKRDALFSWPDSTRMLLPCQSWPIRFRRWIDMKVVYRPSQPLEAKAYLGFMPHFSFF